MLLCLPEDGLEAARGALLCEALGAIDRSVAPGPERHLGVLSTLAAGNGEELSWAVAAASAASSSSSSSSSFGLARLSTRRAALRFRVPLGSKELLVVRRKSERLTAVLAGECSVGVGHATVSFLPAALQVAGAYPLVVWGRWADDLERALVITIHEAVAKGKPLYSSVAPCGSVFVGAFPGLVQEPA